MVSAPRISCRTTRWAGWSRLESVTVDIGDGTVISREIEDHGSAVGVFLYDPTALCTLMVRQVRPAILHAGPVDLLEIPAGLLDGLDEFDAAAKEVLEEVGVRITQADRIGRFWTMPGLSSEQTTLYLAAYGAADRVAPGGGLKEEGESLAVHEIRLQDLPALIESGDISDMKSVLTIQSAMLRMPHLFLPLGSPNRRPAATSLAPCNIAVGRLTRDADLENTD